MNSEKVEEIKKALGNCQKDNCLDCPYFIDEKRCRANDLLLDAINLINELESENEILKINMHETENLSFKINQMNGDLILENQALKDRIAELEEENGELKEHVTEVEKGIINIAKERNKKDELASKFIDSYNDSLKQFAEKLKKIVFEQGNPYNVPYEEFSQANVLFMVIDELLKEYEE